MINFFRRDKKSTAGSVIRESFASGLETGIEMVRIAAASGKSITLTQLADIMQQTLIEFKDGH